MPEELYTFDQIKNDITEAIRGLFPINLAADGGTLELTDLEVVDNKDSDDIKGQYGKILERQSWAVPVYGTFRLRDADGKTVRTERSKILDLPKLTDRKTFIIDGKERHLQTVLRRKSGIFAHFDERGDLLAEFMLDNGLRSAKDWDQEGSFKIRFDQQQKKFNTQIGKSSKKLNTYVLLDTLGYDTSKLSKVLGKDVYEANLPTEKEKASHPGRIYKAIYGKDTKSLSQEDIVEGIRSAFERTKIDPENVSVSLGRSSSTIDGETLARSLQKLLDVSRGTKEEDDRESLFFKKAIPPYRLISERIVRNTGNLQKNIRDRFRSITKKEKSDKGPSDEPPKIVPTGFLNSSIKEVFIGKLDSSLADSPNPVGLWSGFNRISMMGTGGIRSLDRLPEDSPLISPSQLGYIDPIHTPEGKSVGVSLHIPKGVRFEGDNFLARMLTQQGDTTWVPSGKAAISTIAFPDQYDLSGAKPKPRQEKVLVQTRGKIERIDPKDVDYIIPDAQNVFDPASNLIPFLQSNQGNRAMFGGKHETQIIPLKNREQPLIQTGMEHELADIAGAKRSPVDGTISQINKLDGEYEIRIRPKQGKRHSIVHAYRNFPMAKGSVLDSDLKVKVGDTVAKGDLIADSTFTKDGVLSMGKNLLAAYMNYHGYNFEDAIVISEKAAKDLTSIHLHERNHSVDDPIFNRAAFLNRYRSVFTSPEEINALDGDGIIRKGSKIVPGQILVAGLRKAPPKTDREQRLLRKMRIDGLIKSTLAWDRDVPGEVIDVSRTKDGIKIFVRTEEPVQVGDKLVNRNAAKGVVSKIIPTEEMPKTKEGRPIDILLAPLGVPGRINLGQVLETAQAKSIEKSGKPIIVSPFSPESYIDQTEKMLKDSGIKAEEELLDPTRGNRPFGKKGIFVGPQYFYKMEHQVTTKEKSRMGDRGYDQWDTPTGGEFGAQTLGELGTYALLGHGVGAVSNLRDMQLYKSQKNLDRWGAIVEGKPIPVPKHIVPNVRFESLLRVAGVKLQKGDPIKLIPQTDKDTEAMSHVKSPLKDAGLMYANKYGKIQEEKGGLFDPDATGGTDGTKWTYFRLAEPVVSPIFTPAVLALTGWKAKELEEIADGKAHYKDLTGGEAIHARLKEIDLDKTRQDLLDKSNKIRLRKTKNLKDKAADLTKVYKQIRYIDNLQSNHLRPEDAFLMQDVPVIPPKLRPVLFLSSGQHSANDLNYLYRDLSLVSDTLKEAKALNLPEKYIEPLRSALHDGTQALIQATSGSRPLSGAYQGALGTIAGKRPKADEKGEEGSPKSGLFQTQITRRRQDFSARAAITVEPRLDLDSVGMPFEMAYTLYHPWAIRELSRDMGVPVRDARKYYDDKGSTDMRVRRSLISVADKRPVLVKRDPALHKFNVMAFRPKLVEGKALQIHPLVTGGFGADFDGDTMSVYVPVIDSAVKEAYTMLPSRNLYSPASGKLMYTPNHEMLWGLYSATQTGSPAKKGHDQFNSFEEARKAFHAGEIDRTNVIQIKGDKTTLGWEEVNQILPKNLQFTGPLEKRKPFTKDSLKSLVGKLAPLGSETFASTVDQLKNVGNRFATEEGLSFTIQDFKVIDKPFRDKALKDVEEAEAKGDTAAMLKTLKSIDEHTRSLLSEGKVKNNIWDSVSSGARSDWTQMRQIVTSPLMVYDPQNRLVPRMIRNSYAEGLNLADYWTSLHGARKGAINKSISTAEPGYLSKQIMRSVIDQPITTDDCKTREGIRMSTNSPEILGRYLVKDVKVKKSGRQPATFSRGTLVTPSIASSMAALNVPDVEVRSALRCHAKEGVCSKCYGLNEENHETPIGTNVGVLAAQSIGEPSTQLSLKVFHTGGTVEASGKPPEGDRFNKVEHLLRLTEQIPQSAILMPINGTVKHVREAPQGGWEVDIKDRMVYVPHDRKLFSNIRPGKQLKRGEPLTHGIIHPVDVMKTKGAYAGQMSIVNQLRDLFEGMGVKQKHFEIVAKSMSNYTQVTKPGESQWLPGEILPVSEVKDFNRGKKKKEQIRHTPLIRGIGSIPLLSQDWVARLNAEKLRATIIDAASMGLESKARGVHPIPPLTFLGEPELRADRGFGLPIPRVDANY